MINEDVSALEPRLLMISLEAYMKMPTQKFITRTKKTFYHKKILKIYPRNQRRVVVISPSFFDHVNFNYLFISKSYISMRARDNKNTY